MGQGALWHRRQLTNTGLVRFVNGTLARIRADGTWAALYRKWLSVLGPVPAPRSHGTRASDMTEPLRPRKPQGRGTRRQPAELFFDSASTVRPMATQAVYRSNSTTRRRFGAHRRYGAGTTRRRRPGGLPARRLGGGLVEIPRCHRSTRWPP